LKLFEHSVDGAIEATASSKEVFGETTVSDRTMAKLKVLSGGLAGIPKVDLTRINI
jgi:hypothetical protein